MINGITLLDCTLREVGYQTGWYFDESFMRAYYRFAESVGFDYLELGFFHNPEADPNRGIVRYCSVRNDELREVFGATKNLLKLTAMRDIQRPLVPLMSAADSVIDVVRILTRSPETNLDILSQHVEEIQTLGYEVWINFTSAGRNTVDTTTAFSKFAAKMGVPVIYFADTESIFTAKYVADVIDISRGEGVEPGIHLHNKNGTAKSLLNVALAHNVKYTDTTLLGLGGKWHDGNVATESLLEMFSCNPGYELTRLKTELVQQLIKYHEHSAAVWQ